MSSQMTDMCRRACDVGQPLLLSLDVVTPHAMHLPRLLLWRMMYGTLATLLAFACLLRALLRLLLQLASSARLDFFNL